MAAVCWSWLPQWASFFVTGQRSPPTFDQDTLGVSLPSLAVLRVLPEHRRGLGKTHLTGMTAVAPSSLGSHLQVPRVQSSQGPGGGGPATTPVPRRGLCACW